MATTSILLTGATGYIGSQVVLELLARYGDRFRLKILARQTSDCSFLSGLPVDIIRADLLDVPAMSEAFVGVDTVFHCAGLIAYTRNFRNRLYEVNVVGTRNVVNASIEHGVRRLVVTSSIAAIGGTEDGSPASESSSFMEWQRRNGYMESKHLAELEALRGVAEGLDTVLVNPGVVIGVDKRNKASVSSSNDVLRMISEGQLPFCPSGGTGFVDVRDVAMAHVKAWQKGVTGQRYIIVGHNKTFSQLFEALRGVSGSSPDRKVYPFGGFAAVLAGVGGEIWSLLFNRPSFISLESSRMASKKLAYLNDLSVQELGMAYRPLEDTLATVVQ
ncbi:MAG: NAD-dependent epimerase/dehydratase family protein [Chlorobium sp.]|jgi:dihydroflavonol-4-reductase|uniref:NAD-dependent epimerase/dehydratase family protein n=1 Tax=Chlorobium sp. TaxID=1095 RepID=UPI001DE30676|nr:NAD-dependent epimerase/dehydratase family protein [Chlorobium sp.]MBN1278690.1 NAD-dependent epimerase/dehydratase family protein [Chlorobiaceae bacterium]MCF8215304.1 NAD-dependent epimerase/dehydratase family protein [Chlorobium sp.]MCF8270141.1 NAD-dependent epimerase/dehydratase family protein [Chlorobium sp.]MCF8286511.1 NAD-dependent epimerase/dehydratase family protein [Chlorobium sp.]MCF8290109.1 NAD-dependent epimerase/dehydratase family protein [Chlorobium sp.]